MLEKEIWKDVVGYEKDYQVSNLGRVKSFKKKNYMGRILKEWTDANGYKIVRLSKNGKLTAYKVHRLVATAFIPNPEHKPCVNHIDNNPSNNYYQNLEWCTHKENVEWMCKQGRNKRTNIWIQRLKESQMHLRKPVIATNLSNGEQRVYESISSTVKDGFNTGGVTMCCKHQIKQTRGWKFEYVCA